MENTTDTFYKTGDTIKARTFLNLQNSSEKFYGKQPYQSHRNSAVNDNSDYIQEEELQNASYENAAEEDRFRSKSLINFNRIVSRGPTSTSYISKGNSSLNVIKTNKILNMEKW